jgi:hypothetical protein
MKNYQIIKTSLDQDIILRTDEDGKTWCIPTDPANSDYRAYLAWLEDPEAAQSTPNEL